jgi:hypothetical protein
VSENSVLAKPQQRPAAKFSLATHRSGSRQKKLRVSRFPSPASKQQPGEEAAGPQAQSALLGAIHLVAAHAGFLVHELLFA